MITDPILETDIRFNAATNCFEACVTVHGAGPARDYACTVEGDLTMSMPEAEQALRAEALRRHVHTPGLYASVPANEPIPLHTPERAASSNWRLRIERLSGLRAA